MKNWKVRKMWLVVIAAGLVIGFAACTPGRTAERSASGSAAHLEYPIKNVTFIIPYSAGGTADTVGRLLAQHLSQILDINITCVNKAGASGEIGSLELINSRKDGSVIGTMNIPDFIISDIVNPQFEFDLEKDAEFIAAFNNTPFSYFAPAKGDLNTWDKFVAYAKAHPGEVTVGEGGIAHRILAAAVMDKFGIQFTTVNFAGASETVAALLGGHVSAASSGNQRLVEFTSGGCMPIIWEGKTKPEGFPDCSLFSDYGMDASFLGVGNTVVAPKGVPENVITILEAACAQIANSSDFGERMRNLGYNYTSLVGVKDLMETLRKQKATISAICEKYADRILSNG
jgi:tripartite-type tricarboxylate transporter receptor subunit TctC